MGSEKYTVDAQGRIVVPINDFSDGDPNAWPQDSNCKEADPTIYLEKLGVQWMQSRNEFQNGKTYILDQLPEGYIYYARARRTQTNILDKFLWGHPSGKYYFSPKRFWPHFIYLMNGGSDPCQCDLCGPARKSTTLGRPSTAMASRRPGRPAGIPRSAFNDQIGSTHPATGRGRRRKKKFLVEDAEGNQDIFKEMVHNLHIEGTIDTVVSEPASMDWRTSREPLRNHLTRVRMQHSFLPRLGELVLWHYDIKGEIKFERKTETFQVYSHKRQKFMGIPQWFAGVVSQVPDEPLVLQDAVIETNRGSALNISGFRVEMFPDPNTPDKSLSNQYKYVPLSNIRPFSYWSVYLQGVESKDIHPSIPNALTIMSSFSMLDKYHFKGEWPNASILCEGIYLGAELLIRGDGVRLIPRDSEGKFDSARKVTDILVVEKIELRLENCDANLESPLLCELMFPRLIGKVYTMDTRRAYDPSKPMTDYEISQSFECTGMREYGSWYRLRAPDVSVEVSIDQVIGRCYESEYMDIMFQDLALDIDLDGVRGGRKYGQKTDDRIAPGKEWFLGDYRMQTLALESLNGIEDSRNDESRDQKMCRAILKIIDGEADAADFKDGKVVRSVGRPYEGLIGSRSGNTKFESAGKHSSMVSTALGGEAPYHNSNATPMETPALDTGADDSGEDEEGSGKNGMLSDSDDDLIIRPKPKRRRQL